MKFQTHTNNESISLRGTHLVGYLITDYTEVIRVFGEPQKIVKDGLKIDAQWKIQFNHPDGELIASIYNYKDGKNYMGDQGDSIEEITEWHIGGKTELAVQSIKDAFAQAEGKVFTDMEYMKEKYGLTY